LWRVARFEPEMVVGNRLVIADSYQAVATPPLCAGNLSATGTEPKFDTIDFSGSSIMVSLAASRETLSGTVSWTG